MNKYCYRHVFNKARGIMMVVSDIVRSRSKASGGGTVARNVKVKSASFTPISFAIRLALGAVILPVSAQAEIIADRAAPSDQRPTILVTPNDIPLVNIRTPNSAGVSHNTYQQFDVQQQGVILNNSRTNVQTLQGGWVEGNPWLATGGARVILNEVNSSDPSMLNGYVEVAGQQAQVVIANPAGVTCTDCGFINANRVTLTSGRPVIRNGNLESYRVEGGAVTIAGENGMDSSTADYTDLIAQSVQLNAKVWANELKVTTGNNEVNADNTEAIEIAVPAAAAQPAYAIDVAQLGGMYAGKIVLVGTQAGVGVRNAGDIGASAGEVVISADGRIENSGTLRNSAGDIQIATNTGVDNRGTLLANGSIRVTAQGETSQVNSTTEAIIAAGVQDDGSIGNSGNISLNAGDNVTLSGKSFSGGTHSVTAATVDLSGSQTSAQQVVLTAHEGDVDLSNAVLVSEQNLQIATPTALITHQADLSSGSLTLNAATLSNTQGQIKQTGQGATVINVTEHLDNQQGLIASNSSNLELNSTTLTNTQGSLIHAGNGQLTINTSCLNGTQGEITTNGDLDISATTLNLNNALTQSQGRTTIESRTFNHRGSTLIQSGDSEGQITASSLLDNTGGTLASQGSMTVTVGRLTNRGGVVQVTGSESDLNIQAAGHVDNGRQGSNQGDIYAAGDLTLTASSLDNQQGEVKANQNMAVTLSGSLDNRSGTVVASQQVNVQAAEIDNTQGAIASLNADAALLASQGVLDNINGRIEADALLSITSEGLNNSTGILVAGSQQLNSGELFLNNQSGQIVATGSGDLSITSGELNNHQGLIQSQAQLTINTQGRALINHHTLTDPATGIKGQGGITLSAGHIDNQSGYLSGHGLNLSGEQIDNREGLILTESGLMVSAQQVTNQGGQIQVRGAANIQVADHFNNTEGWLYTGSRLTLNAGLLSNDNTQSYTPQTPKGIEAGALTFTLGSLSNQWGQLTQVGTGASTLTISGDLNNNSGRLFSNSDHLTLSADSVNNQSGILQHSGNRGLTVNVAQVLDNRSGVLASNHAATYNVGDLINSGGSVQVVADGQNLTLNATGRIENGALDGVQGDIYAGGTIIMAADSLNNNGGRWATAGGLQLTSRREFDNTGGTLIAQEQLVLNASEINNHQGTIASVNADVALTATNGQINNSEGRVEAVGAITIDSQGLDNSNGVLLAGTQEINTHTGIFNNQAGLVVATSTDPADTLTITSETLNNAEGLIQAEADLQIEAQSLINTDSGDDKGIVGGGRITLNADEINNQTGYIGSQNDLSLTSQTFNNNQGLLRSAADLSVQGGQFDNQGGRVEVNNAATFQLDTPDHNLLNNNEGLLLVGGTLSITADTLQNDNTQSLDPNALLGIEANTFDLTLGNLSNALGRFIQTGMEDLSLSLTGTFNNTGGAFAANGSNFTLNADTFHNTDGQLIHAGLGNLELTASTLNGERGDIATNGDLTINASALTLNHATTTSQGQVTVESATFNHQQGTLVQAGDSSTSIIATTQLDNSGGTLASQGSMDFQVGDLINRGGVLQATGSNNNVTINATGTVDNSQGGDLYAAQNVTLNAAQMINDQGQIVAENRLNITTDNRLDNGFGTLSANQQIILNASEISNSGHIHSVLADIDLTATQGQVSNAGGRINAATELNVTSQGLNNQSGVMTALRHILNAGNGSFNNQSGQIAAIGNLSTDTVNIISGALNNDQGLIQAIADISIDTQGATLSNNHSGADKGIISRLGSVTLSSGDFDNLGGFVGSAGELTTESTRLDNSQNGALFSETKLHLKTETLVNQNSQIQATEDLLIDLGQGEFNNIGSLLRTNGHLEIIASKVLNSDTADPNQGIEAKSLSVETNVLDNTDGQIRINEAVNLKVADHLDNTRGVIISASDDIRVRDTLPGFPDLEITNTEGTFLAAGTLDIDSHSLTGDGSLFSQGDINIRLDEAFHHTGELYAVGNASLHSLGHLHNQGRIAAHQALDIQAISLSNDADAEIKAGHLTITTSNSGILTNRGLIDANTTDIDAYTLNNLGTGRIYGDHLRIDARNLYNQAENGSAAVIAARTKLDIGAGVIDNRDHALIFSMGNIHLGGELNSERSPIGKVTTLNNASATIEALGNIYMTVGTINNLNQSISVGERSLPSEAILEYQLRTGDVFDPRATGAPYDHRDKITRYKPHQVRLYDCEAKCIEVYANGDRSDEYITYDFTRSITETVITGSDPGKIIAGGSITVAAGALNNHSSQIIAGGNIYDSHIGVLNNTTITGTRTITDVGNAILKRRHRQSGSDTFITTVSDYNPTPAVENINLTVTVYEANSAGGSGAQVSDYSDDGSAPTATGASQVDDDLQDQNINGSNDTINGNTGLSADAESSQTAAEIDALRDSDFYTQEVTSDISTRSQLHTRGATAPAATSTGFIALEPIVRFTQNTGENAETPSTVLTGGFNRQVTNSSLFTEQLGAPNDYLIETDSNFITGSGPSSDYLLEALGRDPASVQQRLGDGFYEQRLVQQQITTLTGRRYLAGYSSDEAQYQQLLEDGATFAKAYQLQPGIELSADQMAQLTTDIVWLVQKPIMLANGDIVQALVPQLYLRVDEQDLSATGGLIAADNNLMLEISGDLNNFGNIAGRQITHISADNLNNWGGHIRGESVQLDAATDVNNYGGTVSAENHLIINAGRDVRVQSTTATQPDARGDRTHIDRVAGLYVSNSEGLLNIYAGRDLILTAAGIQSQGSMKLSAQNDVRMETQTIQSSHSTLWDNQNYTYQTDRAEIGSNIQSNGDLTIEAGNDIHARAAQVNSQAGLLTARAGQTITLEAGERTQTLNAGAHTVSRGFFSTRTLTTHDDIQTTGLQSTNFNGQSVNFTAGHDINILGSHVLADGDIDFTAGNDVNIHSGQHQFTDNSDRNEQKSGLMSGGSFGFTLGGWEQNDELSRTHTTQVASTVGSLDGNITIHADNDVNFTAADILARTGEILVTGDNIDPLAAYDILNHSETHRFEQSGLTIALSGGIVGSLQTLQNSAERIQDTSNDKLSALHAWRIGRVAGDLSQQVDNLDHIGDDFSDPLDANLNEKGEAAGSGVNLSISLGSSESQNSRQIHEQTALGTSIIAGGTVTLIATADENREDSGVITTEGALIEGDNVFLHADNGHRLLSAENHRSDDSQSESSSAGFGIAIGSGGLQFSVNASTSRGEINQSNDQYLETIVRAINTAQVTSAGDVTLEGAQIHGNRVIADIGGQLNIISQQDEEHYHNQQESAGISVGFGIGAQSPVNVSVNTSELTGDSEYIAVQEQSGIFAGEGGYSVNVGGHTQLTGAAIVSEADPGNNRFSTDTLGYDHLQNHAIYDVESTSVGFSTNASLLENIVGLGGISSDQSGEAESTTVSVISNGKVDIRSNPNQSLDDLITTRAYTHEILERIFSDDIIQDVEDDVELQQMLSQEVPLAIGDYAQEQLDRVEGLIEQANNTEDPAVEAALMDQAQAITEAWGEGGTHRVALHTFSGALSGDMAGAVGAYTTATIISDLSDALDGMGISETSRDITLLIASAAIGGASNGGTGAVNTSGQTVNNYLKHNEIHALAEELRECSDRACQLRVAKKYRDKSEINKITMIDACAAHSDACHISLEEIRSSPRIYQRAIAEGQGFAMNILYGFAVALPDHQAYGEGASNGRSLEDMGFDKEQIALGVAILGAIASGGRSGATTRGRGQDNEVAQGSGSSTAGNGRIGSEVRVSVDTSRATRGTPEYETLNNPPANTRVELDNGTTFKTGEGGYVEEVTYRPVDSPGVRDSRQTAVGKEGIAGDVGGHIQACRHGGTCDRFNLFPQNSNFNNSAYKKWENEITRAMLNGDDVGNVTVRLNRADPYNSRPDSIEIEYQINGVNKRREFENQGGN